MNMSKDIYCLYLIQLTLMEEKDAQKYDSYQYGVDGNRSGGDVLG